MSSYETPKYHYYMSFLSDYLVFLQMNLPYRQKEIEGTSMGTSLLGIKWGKESFNMNTFAYLLFSPFFVYRNVPSSYTCLVPTLWEVGPLMLLHSGIGKWGSRGLVPLFNDSWLVLFSALPMPLPLVLLDASKTNWLFLSFPLYIFTFQHIQAC